MSRLKPLPIVLICAFVWAAGIGMSRARGEVLQAKSGAINVEPLAQLDNPWGMEWLPDQRTLLITEKPGRLRTFADGKLSEPIAGVPKVAFRGQGGLLDVRVDPNFATNRLIYLSYAEPAEQQPPDAKDTPEPRLGPSFKADDPQLKGGAVARAKLADDDSKLEDLHVIWRQTPKTVGRGHYGGRLLFGPDGKLYITSGERQRFEPAQDPKVNLGRVIRINPDGSIPQDNPFVNKPGQSPPDAWTMGNRNPLGFAFHPKTGQLWMNEMGPKGGDELNLIEPGKNYGWPIVSEGKHYNDAAIPPHSSHPEFTPPNYAWNPVISPSGMAFYTGTLFSQWTGSALIGGLSSKALVRVTVDNGPAREVERVDMKRRIRDVIQAPDGAVLLLSDGPKGELLRLTPAERGAGTSR